MMEILTVQASAISSLPNQRLSVWQCFQTVARELLRVREIQVFGSVNLMEYFLLLFNLLIFTAIYSRKIVALYSLQLN
jgi:hypothetical protein